MCGAAGEGTFDEFDLRYSSPRAARPRSGARKLSERSKKLSKCSFADGPWDEPPGCREDMHANYRGQKRVTDRRESSSVLLVNKPREVSTGADMAHS